MGFKDKNKQNEYQRKWVAERKATWFADKFCVVCNSTDNLELDHIDPALKISHSIWSWSEIRRQEELIKCQVLCHDCHLIKSYTIQLPDHMQAKHGNHSMYRKYKCRCELCLIWRKSVDKNYMPIIKAESGGHDPQSQNSN